MEPQPEKNTSGALQKAVAAATTLAKEMTGEERWIVSKVTLIEHTNKDGGCHWLVILIGGGKVKVLVRMSSSSDTALHFEVLKDEVEPSEKKGKLRY